ncbi:SLBB domain-containing protein [Estrella lausannensis]|uniref:Putative membrane protein n=1 Tax=Estrella lausannensis TaxID=483423 RepID=A0A0H5DNF4_9BACT|nr:SLBB domain-containing protein [Estrella lausannensis]CRX37846.1 putative membrane protein [Estrella lausannensis]
MKTDVDKTLLWKREWTALSVFAAFIMAVIAISYVEEREKSAWLLETDGAAINVYVEGAVDSPGIHRLATGAKLAEVLQEAGVKPEGRVDGWNLARVVADGERIVVKERKMISIVLIYPGGKRKSKAVPKGMRVADLTRHLALEEYVVVWGEKKRKQLREGDEVVLKRIAMQQEVEKEL